MIGDIIVVVLCFGLILVFREIDKQNRSLDKVKKFADKIIADFTEYFKGQSLLIKNSTVELDVKQSQAVAAVKRLDETIQEFDSKNAVVLDKISLVDNLEKRLSTYDKSLNELFEMTDRVEENLEKIRKHSIVVHKVSSQLEEREKQLARIENDIPNIVSKLHVQNEEQMKLLSADFSSWVEGRTADLQTLANDSVDKNELLLEEIKNVYDDSFRKASQKANDFESSVFDALRAETKARTEQFEEKLTESTKDLNDYLDRERSQIEQSFNASLVALNTEISQNMTKHKDFIESTVKKQLSLAISEQEEKIMTCVQESTQKIENEISRQDGQLSSIVTQSEHVASCITSLEEDFETKLSLLAEKSKSEIGKQEAELKTFEDNFIKIREMVQGVDESVLTKQDEIKAMVSNLRSEVLQETNQKTTDFLNDIEKQMSLAKKDIDYRLERISAIGDDIDSLEANLRRLMDGSEERVNADFERFRAERLASQTGFESETKESYNRVRAELDSLENELNILKATASKDVSEKLRLFEDSFFTDLEQRSESMTDSLNQWKIGFDTQLSSLSTNLEDNTHSIESNFTDDMKNRFASLQEKYGERLTSIDDDIKKTEGEYTQRVSDIEKDMHIFMDEHREKLSHAKQDADNRLKADYANYCEETGEKLKRFEKDISNQLAQINQSVFTVQNETSGSIEGLLSEITSWRERLDEQLKENNTIFAERFESLQKKAEEQIVQVEQEFSTDIAHYVSLAKEEKDRIALDIDDLKADTQKSLETYQVRSDEMVADFKKSYELMLQDTQKRIGGENSESEKKIRALRQMVQEARQESEDMQEKVVLKIQTEANLLKMNMDDVDKRLKYFIAQTQLIEKADEMRDDLQNQMSELRNQITRFEGFKQISDRIEGQFTKIIKLDDDTITKMDKIIAEKNKIDALEADFTKLIGLSTSMDQKINDLKSTSDELQILQIEVRRFQENLGEISNRYDRFEKKHQVLDQTIIDIDKMFEKLRNLENRLEICTRDTNEMPSVIEDIKIELTTLIKDSRSITDVSDKLQDLDQMLAQTNTQVQEVQRTRDNFIKLETRLADMIKDAKEQINLFRAVKDGRKKEDGAPPLAVRENVLKLAHQGWKAAEISQSLNLTLSEVELILDLYGSNR